MCGIAGIVHPRTVRDVELAAQSLVTMRHRGPDDQGWLLYSREGVETGRAWQAPGRLPEVAFFHRRLSIVDLSEGGRQPMSTADGRYHIVYNGEIYNYLELRRQLENLGYSFRTQSDTEVLLAAYAAWGSDALARVVGMFAFAVADCRRRTLFLARDPFGIKPLYYSFERSVFRFASEIKALLESHDGEPQRVNKPCMLRYLRFGMTEAGSETLLERIQQVPAAHYFELSLDLLSAPQPACYWRPAIGSTPAVSFEDAAQEVRRLFLRNVDLHLRSDVLVGSALSGGIDSSSVVMAVRHLRPEAELHTVSFIAEDRRLSEERWVDVVSRAGRTVAHKVRTNEASLIDDLDSLLYHQDQPFGGGSLYAQYRVFAMARENGIKVMLDGQGGDEFLGGYHYYLGARLTSLVRQRKWSEALGLLHACSRLDDGKLGLWLMYAADYALPKALNAAARKIVGRGRLPAWINARWFRKHGIELQPPDWANSTEVLKSALCRDLTTSSLPDLMRYEDRNSMAFSVESRVPFLTTELVSFVLSLPEEYLIGQDGTTKAVFRRAMRGIVPDCVLDRQDKLGFATPEWSWLRNSGQWVERVLRSEAAWGTPCLNVNALAREWARIRGGRQRTCSQLWRSLMLICWTNSHALVWG